jgi:hypothetical protein
MGSSSSAATGQEVRMPTSNASVCILLCTHYALHSIHTHYALHTIHTHYALHTIHTHYALNTIYTLHTMHYYTTYCYTHYLLLYTLPISLHRCECPRQSSSRWLETLQQA